MAKLKTPEQKEREKNARTIKKYGVTLSERKLLSSQQGHVCKICESGGGIQGLHLDHDHKWKYIKIHTEKDLLSNCWNSYTTYRGTSWVSMGNTKSEAIQTLRKLLQKLSIRGLVCWPCNRLLRMAFDQSERLSKAAQYIRDFQTITASAPTIGEIQ